jgi:hypothetical protein
MEFDPTSGGLLCRYCRRQESLPAPAKPDLGPHSLTQALERAPTRRISDQACEVSCQGCGAVVAFQPPEVAGVCAFCGAVIVAQPKAADPLIAPDGVLPARISREHAQTEVQKWLSTRWFAPNALKALASQEGIGGVYLPFWSYDADTETRYRGERGDYYYVTEEYNESDGHGRTVRRTRQVRHTRWQSASGRVGRRFDDVLIAATQAVSESRLNALEPWGLEALSPYQPAFLAGFKAQRYQVGLPEGFERAKAVMHCAIEVDVRRDIGGDEQRLHELDTRYFNTTFRHLLLPVWIGAYRFQSKVYQVIVNACTGEVQGERPYSALKIALLALFIVAVVLLLVTVFGSSN